MSDLPVVSVFGALGIELESAGLVPAFEARELDCRCYLTDKDLGLVLARDRPVAVVTFGKSESFSELMVSSYEVRRRWFHFDTTGDLAAVGRTVFDGITMNVVEPSKVMPLVTVFTPSYNRGEGLVRPYDSLEAQTWSNWEWVVFDDSDDDGETFDVLSTLASEDHRVRPYRSWRRSGRVGDVKRDACMLGRGEILVELDHDDELTPWALEAVAGAFGRHPEVGFVYTDFAECLEDGSPVVYGEDRSKMPPRSDWGYGYGSYRDEEVGGQLYAVVNAPNVNAKTIRHIVAAPNHARCWRRSVYLELGGHCPDLHVADDYELMVRTFLMTRMCRVPKLCYVQYRNAMGNTHDCRRSDIQRLVRAFSQRYDGRIHERLLELGVDDFVWADGKDTFSRLQSVGNPEVESHCTITDGG